MPERERWFAQFRDDPLALLGPLLALVPIVALLAVLRLLV